MFPPSVPATFSSLPDLWIAHKKKPDPGGPDPGGARSLGASRAGPGLPAAGKPLWLPRARRAVALAFALSPAGPFQLQARP